MTYFTKRYHPPGTSPGTLAEHAVPAVPLKLTLVDYSPDGYNEYALEDPEQCRTYLERPTITWIHVQGDPEPDTVRKLGKLFGLHGLALEDIINTGQRPKMDDLDEQLFAVMSHPALESGSLEVRIDQVSLFLGDHYVISFHPGAGDPFAPVRKRLREQVGRMRTRGADHLFYALLDYVIDAGFPVLEQIGDEIEALEDAMLENPSRESLRRLYQVKRALAILRRMLWPQREVINRLLRDENGLLEPSNKPYFSDCYDHTIQILDLIETYRDMLAGLLDVYLSSASYRMNEIMRVLTVIATIFIPLTFLVGVYGMNFTNPDSPWAMPELRWYYGYPMLWLLMVVIAVGMLVFFRRRNWF